jgi:TRAP-type C4-dicarboxylate transport system permease large subunit
MGVPAARQHSDPVNRLFIDTIAAITFWYRLLPIVLKLGIDPVHFGLIMTLT